MIKWLALRISDHDVPSSNLAGGGIQPMTVSINSVSRLQLSIFRLIQKDNNFDMIFSFLTLNSL